MNRNALHLSRNMAAALLLCTSFVSCSQDDLADTNGEPLTPGEFSMELTTGGLQTVTNQAQASTRATVDDDWNGVSTVAVQVGYDVKSYNVTSADGGKTATLSSDTPFYWENTTEKKTVIAWHPFSKSYPTDWTVKADQSTAASYQASDLVRGELKDLAFADRNDPSKSKMTFVHRTAKVVVNLVAGDGVALDANTSVKLNNLFGVDKGSTITPYKAAINKHTYLALLKEQTLIAKSSFIQVTTGGGTFLYKLPNAKTFKASNAYTYNITVKANGIEVTEATGGEWTDGGSEDVRITISYDGSETEAKIGDYYYADGTWSDGGLRKLYADGKMEWAETTPQPMNDKTCIGIVFYTGRHETDRSDYTKPLSEDGPTIPNGKVNDYVVALTDVHDGSSDRLRWEYGPGNVYNKAIDASTSKSDWQGYSNSLKFHEFVNKNENKEAGWEMKHFPAALACETYGNRMLDKDGNDANGKYDWQKPLAAPGNTSGWFLPSCGQLQYLYKNRSVLSARMTDVKNSTPTDCSYKDEIGWFSTGMYYWSSTEYSRYPYGAWDVDFSNGGGLSYYKDRTGDVRAVLAF